jgi:hypothetical protein
LRAPRPEPRLTLSLVAAATFLVAAPAYADLSDVWEEWKPRIELISNLLQDSPSQIVRRHTVSFTATGSAISFTTEQDGVMSLSLENGWLRRDGKAVARYTEGGALEAAWHTLLLDLSRASTPNALDLIREWRPDGLSSQETALANLLRDVAATLTAPATSVATHEVPAAESGGLIIDLRDLSEPARLAPALRATATLTGEALRVTVPGGRVRAGDFSVGSGDRITGPILVIHGDAEVYGTVIGNVATVDGDIVLHPGGTILGDVLAVAGTVRVTGGTVQGEIRTLDRPPALRSAAAEPQPLPLMQRLARNVVGVLGVFLGLAAVGLGLVTFVRLPLEIVSDTVVYSFGRALMVGLLGQVLVLPTFGMLVVGLVLSVAGILLVPFAVVVFALLLVAAIVGGFLAVAHAMGETMTRRQMARGLAITSANSYRYVGVGLVGLAVLWMLWAVIAPVPLAGTLLLALAGLATWLLASVGFGAALLSRFGLRDQFAGRLLPPETLTDEYLWATPRFGVQAAQRPDRK